MKETRLDVIYFSATATTRRCVEAVAEAMSAPVDRRLNLADRSASAAIECGGSDAVLVAAPVYGGRLPALFVEQIRQLRGNATPAVAMVVYGNRDYDDALLELTDILRENGFRVVAAGAFIGQHSIFPKAGMSRPDADDFARLTAFGALCRGALAREDVPELNIKGNRPYKEYGGVPVHPEGDKDRCTACGVCSELCPADAIDPATPWVTVAGKCISCGRCIVSCPSDARRYKGLKYKAIGAAFTALFSKRREPETFV